MNKKINEKDNKKILYFFVGCIILSLIIIGATFAYFVASTSNGNVVNGGTYTTNFSLAVEKVTSIDMAYGLVPMKNIEAPHAAEQMCHDDNGNAGCQIYKITITTDSNEPFFVDGYLVLNNITGLETRFTRVYPKKVVNSETENEDNIFETKFSKESFDSTEFIETEYIKDGQLNNNLQQVENMNQDDNSNCLLASNIEIGGDNKSVIVYAMIWVYDNGQNQDILQGMQLAYTGTAVFNTAQGNEIKATFD